MAGDPRRGRSDAGPRPDDQAADRRRAQILTGLIIDASVTLAWFFKDEGSAAIDAIWGSTDTEPLVVPAHWFAEVANAMLVGERRKRSTEAQASVTIDVLQALEIKVDDQGTRGALSILLPLARQYRLTVYDAAYLELAMRRNLPLATLDVELAAASRTAGVDLIAL